MPEERVKILILGPSKTGKSNVANYLSGSRETPTTDYRETAPLRIFEVVLEGISVGQKRQVGRGSKCTVELWDVGGNTKFQNCWPAIWNEADGIIFVMNPEVRNQEKELEFWYKTFAGPSEVADEHCLVFCHHSTPPNEAVGANAIPRMPKTLMRCQTFETSLDYQSDDFKQAFERLVESVLKARREKDENNLLQNDMMSGPLLVGVSQ